MKTVEHRSIKNFFNLGLCFIFVLIFLSLLQTSCKYFESDRRNNSNQSTNENTFDVPKAKIDLAKPLEISKKPADVSLCKEINKTIETSKFAQAHWGIIAISLNDNRIVCGIEAQELFNPASIHKLLTSIVALDKLGGDFTWKTSLYAKDEINNGIIEGDLILYGQGSPDLDDLGLNKLVKQLKQKNITKINGDIIGDESFFKGDNFGDGWTWNDLQWYYGAASSALSINRNQIKVTLQNGTPKADSKFVELSGEVKPIEDIEAIGLKRELGTNKIYVWGNGNNLNARIAINKPALLAAKILKEILIRNGIEVEGSARSLDWKSTDKLNTETANEIASIKSQTLAETIRIMNKDSVNLYAELILRTIGKKFGTEAPDEDPQMQKLRGDDSAGASVIKKWLNEQNIATNDIAIHDGSGLSRLDLVSPETIGRALVFASRSNFADILKNSLPVSGKSGTLRGRLGNVSGNILGKTGSITYVNSLAGFARSDAETLAFVIIGNNLTSEGNASETVDKIASDLVKN